MFTYACFSFIFNTFGSIKICHVFDANNGTSINMLEAELFNLIAGTDSKMVTTTKKNSVGIKALIFVNFTFQYVTASEQIKIQRGIIE